MAGISIGSFIGGAALVGLCIYGYNTRYKNLQKLDCHEEKLSNAGESGESATDGRGDSVGHPGTILEMVRSKVNHKKVRVVDDDTLHIHYT